MEPLKRKEMLLYTLLCEEKIYEALQRILGQKVIDYLLLFSTPFGEDCNKTFANVAREDLGDRFFSLNKYLSQYGSVEQVISHIERVLDSFDDIAPVCEGQYLFQYFLPDYERTWGSRGHPNLFAHMARLIGEVNIKDLTEADFKNLYYQAYEKVTGAKLENGEDFYIKKLDPGLGGMSAGCVVPKWVIDMFEVLKQRIFKYCI